MSDTDLNPGAAPIAVLVVTYNSADLIGSCLIAIDAVRPSVIRVWDNASSDATIRVVSEVAQGIQTPVAITRSDTNVGFGAALNALMKECHQEMVLMLNPDCVLNEAAVQRLIAESKKDKRVGLAAPMMLLPDGDYGVAGGAAPGMLKEVGALLRVDEAIPPRLRYGVLEFFRTHLPRTIIGQYAQASAPAQGSTNMDWVSGFCMLVRSKYFHDVGGYDEKFFLYFEDVDLSRRMTDAGYRVILVGDAAVLHHESQSSSGRRAKSVHYYAGMDVYFQKYGNPFQRRLTQLIRRCFA